MIVKDFNEIKEFKKILVVGEEDYSIVQHIINPLKKTYDQRVQYYVKNNLDFKNAIDAVKYKPFFHERWLIVYNNQENKAPIKAQLTKLMTTKNPYHTCIAYVTYKQYKFLLEKEKWVKDPEIGIINLTYLPWNSYKTLTLNNLTTQITNEALNLFLKYITNDKRNILNYIKYLNTVNGLITPASIKELIEDTRRVELGDYFSALLETKERKTISSISDLLTRYRFKRIKQDIETATKDMIDIKNLMYKGYILPYSIYDDIKHLKDKSLLPDNLSNLSFKTLRNYSEIIIKIPIKELILINMMLSKAKDSTHLILITMLLVNRYKWDEEDKAYIITLLTTNKVSESTNNLHLL